MMVAPAPTVPLEAGSLSLVMTRTCAFPAPLIQLQTDLEKPWLLTAVHAEFFFKKLNQQRTINGATAVKICSVYNTSAPHFDLAF